MYHNLEISTKEEDYIGKNLTWKEVVELFPDRWVGLSDYVIEKGTLISGVLQFACIDKELDNKVVPLSDKGVRLCLRRTTELPGGALWL